MSNKQLHVGIVLDESTSMGVMANEAIASFNQTVEGLRDEADGLDITVTLVAFSTVPKVIFEKENIRTVQELKFTQYTPNGWTALYDGTMRCISIMESIPRTDDDAFLLTIITDGDENRSTEVTAEGISTKVNDLNSRDNWTITYLGEEGVDLAQAEKMGVSRGNIGVFSSSKDGSQALVSNQRMVTRGYAGARKRGVDKMDALYSVSANSDARGIALMSDDLAFNDSVSLADALVANDALEGASSTSDSGDATPEP